MPTGDRNPVLVAIDTQDIGCAKELTQSLAGTVGGVKLGLEFFSAHGPAGVAEVAGEPGGLFLDLKYHDIPNTVAGAVRAATSLRPMMLNVHASGGPAMMRAAREAAETESARLGIERPQVIGVTVLTSMDQGDLDAVGLQGPLARQAMQLALLAQDCGLDGVVCSAREIAAIREACGPGFTLVVPGIRPAGTDLADQKRVMTPREAIDAGADWLVIGRPITGAADPVAAAREIVLELA